MLGVWNLGFSSERSSAGAFDSMEAAAGVAAASRVASISIPASRKEWRVVTEHHSVRNPGDEVVVLLELAFCGEPVVFLFYEKP